MKENAHSALTTRLLLKTVNISHDTHTHFHVTGEQIHYSPSLRRQDIGVLLSLEGLSPAFEIKDRFAFYVL